MPAKRVRHPGRVLLEDFLGPFEISHNRLGCAMGVSPRRVNEIILGKRAVTADTALRLSEVLGTRPQYWLSLQNEYDLAQAMLPPERRDRKLPAPKRTRGQRRFDAFRFMPDDD